MEVVSFKLYQRKLIFDDLSAMFYNSRGRDRMGLAGGRGGVWGGWRGERGGGTDRQTETDRQTDRQTETDGEKVGLKMCCFSTVLQVTAVEVKPIC